MLKQDQKCSYPPGIINKGNAQSGQTGRGSHFLESGNGAGNMGVFYILAANLLDWKL